MDAIRVHKFGGPEVLRLENAPDPVPGPGQVLIRVFAAGVNPVDAYLRSGNYAAKPALPYIPGSDAAGVVEEVGDEILNLKTGDRVYTVGTVTGAYAEKTLCEQHQVYHLPDNVSFSQGAGIGIPYSTAYRGLFYKAHGLPGEVVLVHGASGAVGVAAVQLARAAGMKIIGTAGTERGARLALDEGAHYVLDHNDPGHLEKVLEITGNRGVDVVIEFKADMNLGGDLRVLAKNGRVVIIGSRGPVQIDPRNLMSHDGHVAGMLIFNTPPAEMESIQAALGAGLAGCTLRPVIREEIPLNEAGDAHRKLMEPGAYGKIVLIV